MDRKEFEHALAERSLPSVLLFEGEEAQLKQEALALLQKGINPIGFEGLALSISTEDSISINTDPTPKVIISASGMCDAGRIKHHLKHNLWRPESTILFVGYQAEGTLGRMLIDTPLSGFFYRMNPFMWMIPTT